MGLVDGAGHEDEVGIGGCLRSRRGGNWPPTNPKLPAARIPESCDRGDLSAAGELLVYMAVRGAVKNPNSKPGSEGGTGMFEAGIVDAMDDIMVQLRMNATQEKSWKV